MNGCPRTSKELTRACTRRCSWTTTHTTLTPIRGYLQPTPFDPLAYHKQEVISRMASLMALDGTRSGTSRGSRWDHGTAAMRRVAEDKLKRYRAHTWSKRRDAEKERGARLLTEEIPFLDLAIASVESWKKHGGDALLSQMAEYYGLFKQVYQTVVTPQFFLDVRYPGPVCIKHGNIVDAEKMLGEPELRFQGKADHDYTLLMTCPDDNFKDSKTETLHWARTGMDATGKGGQVAAAYTAPTPLRNAGFHRYIFTLLERSTTTAPLPSFARFQTFSTADFMREHEARVAAFAFAQCEWSPTVDSTYRALGIKKAPKLKEGTNLNIII